MPIPEPKFVPQTATQKYVQVHTDETFLKRFQKIMRKNLKNFGLNQLNKSIMIQNVPGYENWKNYPLIECMKYFESLNKMLNNVFYI